MTFGTEIISVGIKKSKAYPFKRAMCYHLTLKQHIKSRMIFSIEEKGGLV